MGRHKRFPSGSIRIQIGGSFRIVRLPQSEMGNYLGMGRKKQFPSLSPAKKAWATRRARRGEQVPSPEGLSPTQKAWQTRRGGKPAFPRRLSKPSFKIVGGPQTRWFAVEGKEGHPFLLGGVRQIQVLGWVVARSEPEAIKLSKKYFGSSQVYDADRWSNFQPAAFNLNYERIGS